MALRRLVLLLPFVESLAISIKEGERSRVIELDKRASFSMDNYYWGSGRGFAGSGFSRIKGIRDVNKSLAWKWHDPAGRYRNVPGGANIDGAKNIYLTSLNGVRKFSPDGEELWNWEERQKDEELPSVSTLYNGAVYTSTTNGRILALSMENGEPLWEAKLAATDQSSGWVKAFQGILLVASGAGEHDRGQTTFRGPANLYVNGLDVKTGQILWTFEPDAPVSNFLGTFVGDGTFVFQDFEGKTYRCNAHDGSLVWKSGGQEGSWTEGAAILGPNGIVYSVRNRKEDPDDKWDATGILSAYKLEDGTQLWSKKLPRPTNSIPAIGRLAGHETLSLVQPVGQKVAKGAPTDIYALDALTGELQWIFEGPKEPGYLGGKGYLNYEAVDQRRTSGVSLLDVPSTWSAPTIDGQGIVFIGNQAGPLLALWDRNGDGLITGDDEVSSFDTEASFSGSSAPAIAPGMMVVASKDQMYVFKA